MKPVPDETHATSPEAAARPDRGRVPELRRPRRAEREAADATLLLQEPEILAWLGLAGDEAA